MQSEDLKSFENFISALNSTIKPQKQTKKGDNTLNYLKLNDTPQKLVFLNSRVEDIPECLVYKIFIDNFKDGKAYFRSINVTSLNEADLKLLKSIYEHAIKPGSIHLIQLYNITNKRIEVTTKTDNTISDLKYYQDSVAQSVGNPVPFNRIVFKGVRETVGGQYGGKSFSKDIFTPIGLLKEIPQEIKELKPFTNDYLKDKMTVNGVPDELYKYVQDRERQEKEENLFDWDTNIF